jgi:hypothetical protein
MELTSLNHHHLLQKMDLKLLNHRMENTMAQLPTQQTVPMLQAQLPKAQEPSQECETSINPCLQTWFNPGKHS